MKSSNDLVYKSNRPPSQFLEELDCARREGLFCDGEVVAQEKTIKVHRVILAAASQYFRNQFELSDTNQVQCLDIDSEDLEYIISFIYLGHVTVPYAKVKQVLVASQKFDIPELAQACRLYLEENFLTGDAFELRSFAALNGHYSLCEKIDSYLKENVNYLYQSKGFLLLPRLQVTLIASQSCSNHELENISAIFERVIAWVQKRQQVR